MRGEVGIKPDVLLNSFAGNAAKKASISASADFSAEVYKKVGEKNLAKVKPNAEKTENVSATNKVEKSEVAKAESGEVVNSTEKTDQIEKTSENDNSVAAMQIQQIAINTLTVENKEDIPEIKLNGVFEGDTEKSAEEAESQNKNLAEEDLSVAKDIKAGPEKIAKLGENVKIETPKTENAVKKFEIAENEIKSEEEALRTETIKAPVEKEGKASENFEINTAQNSNVSGLDLSKVNIKVSDAPLRAESPQMPEQLVDKILYNVDKGKHVFDIELFPDNLGKLEIKMVFEKGVAQLIMTTHSDKAHKLLSQQLDTIRNILEASTQNQSNVEIKENEKASENFDRDSFAGQKEKEQQEQNPKENRKEETESFVDRLKFGLFEEAE